MVIVTRVLMILVGRVQRVHAGRAPGFPVSRGFAGAAHRSRAGVTFLGHDLCSASRAVGRCCRLWKRFLSLCLCGVQRGNEEGLKLCVWDILGASW